MDFLVNSAIILGCHFFGNVIANHHAAVGVNHHTGDVETKTEQGDGSNGYHFVCKCCHPCICIFVVRSRKIGFSLLAIRLISSLDFCRMVWNDVQSRQTHPHTLSGGTAKIRQLALSSMRIYLLLLLSNFRCHYPTQ